ncbi:MAG: stage II sporulation protein P [Firmicutes bacterium]|nr:stage II sporulation protein P [Bacillota bacterium]
MSYRVIIRGFLGIFLLSALILFHAGPVLTAHPVEVRNFSGQQEMDERETGFFSMKDITNEELIMRTARFIRPGDEYITGQNKLYRVEKVEGDIAWARYQEDIKLFEGNYGDVLNSGPSEKPVFQESKARSSTPRFGVYHSHGAESYVPSDGTDSIMEGGGILKVGRTFAEALREKGLKVSYSAKTHVPHDAGAYHRSRRTAEHFLHQGVNTLFDVHRDAVPAEEYTEIVEDKPTVQVQIVVGQQNQNVQSNRNFAEGLKKVADSVHPGLVKGIFMASGSYNQDILPLALLFEVGSHENTQEGAAHSMTLFSDVVETYFLGAPAEQARAGRGLTALKGVLWIILIAGLALGVYLLVGTGSPEELRAKLRHFFSREFAEFGSKWKGGNSSRKPSNGDEER